MSMFSGFWLQDEHMHALLHGQAVSSSSMERYGDKDSDSGDFTPKYTGEHIIMQEDHRCCVGRWSGVAMVRWCDVRHGRTVSSGAGSPVLPQAQQSFLT